MMMTLSPLLTSRVFGSKPNWNARIVNSLVWPFQGEVLTVLLLMVELQDVKRKSRMAKRMNGFFIDF